MSAGLDGVVQVEPADAGLDHGVAELLVDLEDLVHVLERQHHGAAHLRRGAAVAVVLAAADRPQRDPVLVGDADDRLDLLDGGRARRRRTGRSSAEPGTWNGSWKSDEGLRHPWPPCRLRSQRRWRRVARSRSTSVTPGGTGRLVSIMALRQLSLEWVCGVGSGRSTCARTGSVRDRTGQGRSRTELCTHCTSSAPRVLLPARACWDRTVSPQKRGEVTVSGRLEGKIVLLTGIGSGMGRVTAQLLAREGATVVGCDLNPEGAAETVRLVESEGGIIDVSAPVDLSSRSDVETWVERCSREARANRRALQQREHAEVRAVRRAERRGLPLHHRQRAAPGLASVPRRPGRTWPRSRGAIVNIGSGGRHRGRARTSAGGARRGQGWQCWR